jgi:hypothetical protein
LEVTVDSKSITRPAPTDTRETRALALYRSRAGEIERIGEDLYLVPSCTGEGRYRVDYERETCNCPDSRRHPGLNCKHVLCVGVLRAKRRRVPPASLAKPPDHIRILDNARAHPERTYREHIEAAEEIAAAEYRAEIRAMMRAGTLDPESDEL